MKPGTKAEGHGVVGEHLAALARSPPVLASAPARACDAVSTRWCEYETVTEEIRLGS